MTKSKFSLSRIYHICWLIFFAALCLPIAYQTRHIALILCGAVLLGALVFLYRKYHSKMDALSDRKVFLIAGILLILQTAALLLMSKAMLIKPFNDSGTIWFSAADIAETGVVSDEINEYTSCSWVTGTSNHGYLLIHPNSRFLVAFLAPYCKLLYNVFAIDLRGPAGYFAASVLNILCIVSAELFLFLSARKERGNSSALLALLICLGFFPYYLNAQKLYSDTLTMPFVALPIYLMILADRSTKTAHSLSLRALAGVVIGFGYLLKGSVAILAIACAIYVLVRRKSWKTAIPSAALILAGVVLVAGWWSAAQKNLPWLDLTEADRYELPLTHWIMMASTGDGGFSHTDIAYSLSFDSYAAKSEAIKAEWFRRIQEHGALGYLKFNVMKISSVLADGLYYQTSFLDPLSSLPIFKLLNPAGPIFRVIKLYTTVCVWALYLCMLFSAWRGTRADADIQLLFHICTFGVILFFCLWEAKSRYLLDFTPMFILEMALTIPLFPERQKTK